MDMSKSESMGVRAYSSRSPVSYGLSQSTFVNRSSVAIAADKRKAHKIRLFRNGDQFFKGLIFPVAVDRYRTFNSLLAELNRTELNDLCILPKGIRYIFTSNGDMVKSLEQMRTGEAFVCSSSPVFQPMDYIKNVKMMTWRKNFRVGDESKTSPVKSFGDFSDFDRSFIHTKVIYTIRAGPKPRNVNRTILNKGSARSYEQLMWELSEALNMETGSIRLLYALSGRQVKCLKDFFRDDFVFVAFGPEKFSASELQLNEIETRLIINRRRVTRPPASSSDTKRSSSKSPERCALSRNNLQNVTHGKISEPLQTHSYTASSRSQQLPMSMTMTRQVLTRSHMDQHLRQQDLRSPSMPVTPEIPRKISMGSSCSSKGNCLAKLGGSACDFDKDVAPSLQIKHNMERSIPTVLQQKYNTEKVVARCGYVYLTSAHDRKTKNSVVMKTYVKSQMNKEKEFYAYSELTLLKRMKHQNILHLLDELDTANDLHLVLEMPKGGDLFDCILSSFDYTEYDASQLFFQLCFAINFLHSMNVVHRNIRMESIMVSDERNGRKHLKLGDFTMASEVLAPLNVSCGTLCYMAPEMLSDKRYGTKVDIWAAGVVGYIMLCGHLPFEGSSKDEILRKIESGPLEFPSPAWDSISDSAKDLFAFMLEEDVNIRSTATDVLDHQWLSDQDKDQQRNNLQPTVSTNILELTGSMDARKRTYAALIGVRHIDEKTSKHQLEVYANKSVDEFPSYPTEASNASLGSLATSSLHGA